MDTRIHILKRWIIENGKFVSRISQCGVEGDINYGFRRDEVNCEECIKIASRNDSA